MNRATMLLLAVLPAMLLSMLIAVSAFSAEPAEPAAAFSAFVSHVGDGDTLWVRVDGRSGKPLKLRLYGIDAPEPCQAWGAQATAALREQALHRRVSVQTRVTDSYGRTVARLVRDGEDLGAWMVREGHAWNDGFARRPGPYAQQQREARAARRGLFADADAIEPRLFRRQHGACR